MYHYKNKIIEQIKLILWGYKKVILFLDLFKFYCLSYTYSKQNKIHKKNSKVVKMSLWTTFKLNARSTKEQNFYVQIFYKYRLYKIKISFKTNKLKIVFTNKNIHIV